MFAVCVENKSYAPEQISQTINLKRVHDEFSAIFSVELDKDVDQDFKRQLKNI